jgi:unsaturated rhamnogalacturonyl hydrolase
MCPPMPQFNRGLGILLLAAGCASACFVPDERTFPADAPAGEGDTSLPSGAPSTTGGESPPANTGTSRGSTDGTNTESTNVVGLAGGVGPMMANGSANGQGAGTPMAGAGGGAGGSAAGVAGGAGGASGSSMTMDGVAPAVDPNVGSSDGTSGSSGTSGDTPDDADVGVIATSVDKFFGDWPAGADPLLVGTRAARIFSSQTLASGSGHDDTDDYKHYKDACAWYGSLSVAELAGDPSLLDALVAKYQPYEGTWGDFNPPTAQNAFVGIIDDSTFGIVPLEIAKLSSDPIYFQEGHLAADHQVVFVSQQLRNASDDMFHVAALQMQAYRVSTDPGDRQRHMDTAADAMVSYLQAMQKANGLLPHHLDVPGFDVSWSRGNGWFAAGLAELMRDIPSSHRDYATIEAGYRRMMSGLLQYQIPAGQPGAGLWKQVVDSRDSRNWVETSGSAMFAYAFISGVRQGLLDVDTYGPAARAAWLGLVGQLNGSGQLQNVSDWLYLPESHGYPANMYAGDEVNYYFERGTLTGDNNGQSPLMWSAAALVRPLE